MTLELQKPRPIWQIMFSTHHTDVGLLYLISSLTFLFLGGSLALGIRAELFLPGSQIDLRPTRNLDKFLGKTMDFKVIKFNFSITKTFFIKLLDFNNCHT